MASAPLTAVIGAGISGLTCAYALKKSGQNVLLLEASPRPGGVIQSVEENGYLFELGPQSFSATSELAELCQELLLTAQVLEAPHGAPRYILIEGKLVKVPFTPALLTSGLLSWGTKLTFLRDILGKTSPPETDESIAAFVRRKFSAQFLDRLVGPFVSGIYAGDPEQLSLRAAFPKLYQAEKAAGSVIRGGLNQGAKIGKQTAARQRRRQGLLSFRAGNETLIGAMATAIGPALRCNVEVREVRCAGNKFRIAARSAAGSEEMTCDQVVLATPTDAGAQILRAMVPGASAALEGIVYAPVAVVSLAYKQQQVARPLSGFGFLAPRSSGLRTLGSVWNSSLFPARAPEGHVLLTNFVGGASDPSATKLSQEELAALVHREIAPILKITGVPDSVRTTRYSQAIPQYHLGHLERLQKIKDSIAQVPRLRLIGNYWKGPAIGACVEQALAVAEEIRIS